MKTIIAFRGYAGSGKDTAADHLVKNYGYTKLSFAEPLKRMVHIAFGFPEEHIWGESKLREIPDTRYPFSGICPADGAVCEQYVDSYRCPQCSTSYPLHVTPRLALQALGTEWGRRLSPNIWANAALRAAMDHNNPKIVFSDLRFLNELEATKAAGGKVVCLMRGKPQSQHPSEVELDTVPLEKYDSVIDNRETTADMFRSIIDLVMPSLEKTWATT